MWAYMYVYVFVQVCRVCMCHVCECAGLGLAVWSFMMEFNDVYSSYFLNIYLFMCDDVGFLLRNIKLNVILFMERI